MQSLFCWYIRPGLTRRWSKWIACRGTFRGLVEMVASFSSIYRDLCICLSNLSILFLSWSPLTFWNDIPQFCQFGELVDVHCRTTSKSTDLTFSPWGKMVVLCYFLSGRFHIFEKLENAALCPYLQCLLDCRKWCFFSWSMVALLGSSDLCLLSVCLPFRLPCWWRWTMSGRYSQSGISMLWSGSCNDGDPRAKLTKRSKQPIYTRLNVGQFYGKITSKTWFSEQDPSTPIVNCH